MTSIVTLIAVAILAGLVHGQDLPTPGACGVFEIKPAATTRIVNGEAVIPNSRPYQLLLVGYFSNGTAKHYCGASLVKSTHVLTAAHCIDGDKPENIYIFPGLHEFTSAVFDRRNGLPVRQIFKHESYAANGLNNDVAVLRLQNAVTVDNKKVGLICLPQKTNDACNNGDPVVASGWGSTTGNPNRTSASRPVELQQVALQCVPNNQVDCKPLTYLLGIFEQKAKMCAYAPYKSVCFGDSGGPLVRERKTSSGVVYLEQVGIMSGTIDCSFTKPRPDVYASVLNLNTWIKNKIAQSP